jgi:ppGpp synthetase/RelA/SpoT-type nucleotidyltranferase
MSKEVSKTQIDGLGERLKRGQITEVDLRLLDAYRRTFTPSYEFVVGSIRDKLKLEPTGRPAKSTISIIDKLKRESIRLTQIQDIAGCRIIVDDIAGQDSIVQSLTDLFPQSTVIDRREKPSHGYRAVHVVVHKDRKLIEVQVRTASQQLWAELSERISDVIDPSIKYGGGDTELQEFLQYLSGVVARSEAREKVVADAMALLQTLELTDEQRQQLIEALEYSRQSKQDLQMFRQFINRVSKSTKGRP